jgi:hypothetical protein
MVKHGAISRSHVYQMLGSKDARVRRAAFTLLEVSNPRLRRDSELFMEIIRFIWDANPSYDVYREFSKRHLFVPYKVQELIGARIKIEKREEQVRLWSISSRALRALQRVANEVERIINPPPEDNVVAIRSPAPDEPASMSWQTCPRPA